MTVFEVRDRYYVRFGLFSTRAKADVWMAENPLHYFVGIKKILVTPGENSFWVKEVQVA